MNKDKMTLEELATAYNEYIKENPLEKSRIDSRTKDEISPRRIRDYINKEMLSAGIPEGKYKFYNQNHLKELIDLRLQNSMGLSDSVLIQYQTVKDTKTLDKGKQFNNFNQDMGQNVFGSNMDADTTLDDIISGIENQSKRKQTLTAMSAVQPFGNKDLLRSTTNIKANTINEYEINKDIKLSVKSHINYNNKEINNILSDIETILKTQNKEGNNEN